PPENPWFTYRATIGSSMPSIVIFSLRRLRKARAEVFSPFTALYADRRKFTTDTPGISVGYWKARNSPIWARRSGLRTVMSWPLNRIWPSVPLYPGRPMITFASVDFPDPFGPMMAWTSPWGTTRSIPFRICLPSTSTRSPRTSRVTVSFSVSVCATSILQLDEQLFALHLHLEGDDVQGRRKRPRPAGF